jgi:hypothetical protein
VPTATFTAIAREGSATRTSENAVVGAGQPQIRSPAMLRRIHQIPWGTHAPSNAF